MAISRSNVLSMITGGLLSTMTGDTGQAEIPEAAPAAASTEPAAETIAKSQETAQAATTAKKRAVSRSRSVFSSPLGIAGEAATIKKTLLGQ
jgi:hypothetical protein